MTAPSSDRTTTVPDQPIALFLDFDNTITLGDVLDLIIERYSVTNRWRHWEMEWQRGRASTRQCLEQQIADLRVTSQELVRFTDRIAIDEAFVPLVAWAKANDVEISIVSDNFAFVIEAMLRRRGLPDVPIYANRLTFTHDRPRASFPFLDANCKRCAHCKAQHLRRASGRTRVFVGDGLSDICPATIADVAFAKHSLAAHLRSIGSSYLAFRSLADVLEFLQTARADV